MVARSKRTAVLATFLALVCVASALAEYNPLLGRFLQRDPVATGLPVIENEYWFHGRAPQIYPSIFDARWHYNNGMNLSQYVGSNPVNRRDPLGLEWGIDDEINGIIYDYVVDVGAARRGVEVAKNMIRYGSQMAALNAMAAFGWDEVVWDQGEAALLGLVTGGFFARACFEEGTLVTLEDGTTESIECVNAGARVMSWPAEPGAPAAESVVDPKKWRLIWLEAIDAERGTISICLLRHMAWVGAMRIEAGRHARLAVAEMGLDGWAEVCSVGPCPPEAAGSIAGLVTGVFQTERAELVSVYVDSLTEPIGATASHPFFSIGRNAWVGAGSLQAGERVRTSDGDACVTAVETRATAQTVYNLEVQQTHTYFVSKAKVWVHNGCVPDVAKQSSRNFRSWARSFSNPQGSRMIGRGEFAEVVSEAEKLGFRNIRREFGGPRSGQWTGKWHINMDGPDGGRTLHLLTEEP